MAEWFSIMETSSPSLTNTAEVRDCEASVCQLNWTIAFNSDAGGQRQSPPLALVSMKAK